MRTDRDQSCPTDLVLVTDSRPITESPSHQSPSHRVTDHRVTDHRVTESPITDHRVTESPITDHRAGHSTVRHNHVRTTSGQDTGPPLFLAGTAPTLRRSLPVTALRGVVVSRSTRSTIGFRSQTQAGVRWKVIGVPRVCDAQRSMMMNHAHKKQSAAELIAGSAEVGRFHSEIGACQSVPKAPGRLRRN